MGLNSGRPGGGRMRNAALRPHRSGMRRAVLSFVLAFSTWAVAAEPTARKTLEITSKPRPGSPVVEVFATTRMAASPESVFAVVTDIGRYPKALPRVKGTQLLARESDTVEHWHFMVSVPVISDRDYAIRLEEKVEGEKRTLSWVPSNRAPPPREGYVRITTTEGGWELTPLDGGKATQVRYRVFVDPAGNVPGFLANKANRDTLPDLFEAVEKEAQALEAKR